ncbi:MAG: IPT/TIG domain-containing protein [Oligoflexia bacterium]|nr:IPT/TIG domain-containing protein [Oligoflexia bacterium]
MSKSRIIVVLALLTFIFINLSCHDSGGGSSSTTVLPETESSIKTPESPIKTPDKVSDKVPEKTPEPDKTSTKAAAPDLSSVFPIEGSIDGGNTLTINGNYFSEGAKVFIGISECIPVSSSINPYLIQCITPSSTDFGEKDLIVKNNDGQQSSNHKTFKYKLPKPSVTGILPASGPMGGGTLVTISGNGFSSGMKVTVGSSVCNNVSLVNRTTLTCITGISLVSGYNSLKVETADHQTGSYYSVTGFTYNLPLSFAPGGYTIDHNTGPLGGNTSVKIDGISDLQEGSSVTVGGVAGTNVVVSFSWYHLWPIKSLSFNTPPRSSSGPVDIVITEPDGQTITIPNGFTYEYPSPIIGEVGPLYADCDQDTPITIRGSNFRPGVNVSIAGMNCNVVALADDGSSLTCNLPASHRESLSAFIVLTNIDRTSAHFASTLNIRHAAIITSITPVTGPISGDSLVLIRGNYFNNGSSVKIGNVVCDSVVTRANTIACFTNKVNAVEAGAKDVEITSSVPGGVQRTILRNSFTYLAGVPAAITPENISATNHFAHTNPRDWLEQEQIRTCITLRRGNGAGLYEGYNLEGITNSLRVKRPVEVFSSLNAEVLKNLKIAYLQKPEIQGILFNRLITYFDTFFPGGHALPIGNHLRLSPMKLIDDVAQPNPRDIPELLNSTILDNGENPWVVALPFGINRGTLTTNYLSITTARDSITNLIHLLETGDINSSTIRNLMVSVKKILKEFPERLDNHLLQETLDKLQFSIIVFSAIGRYCGGGNEDAAKVIANILLHNDPGFREREPATYKEHILSRLDQLREDVFTDAVNLSTPLGRAQPSHTKNWYRRLVHDLIYIPSENEDDPFIHVGDTATYNRDQFVKNFLEGKVGILNGFTEEERRSHKGYTPRVIVRTIIDFLELASNHPTNQVENIRRVFAQNATEVEMDDWFTQKDNVDALSAVGKGMYIDECEDDPLLLDRDNPIARTNCWTNLKATFTGAGQVNVLKETYVSQRYFKAKPIDPAARRYLNDDGLREVLVRIGVLEAGVL